MQRKSEQKRLDASAASTAVLTPRHGRDMKARQCAKIREIGEALRAAGFVSLDLASQWLRDRPKHRLEPASRRSQKFRTFCRHYQPHVGAPGTPATGPDQDCGVRGTKIIRSLRTQ